MKKKKRTISSLKSLTRLKRLKLKVNLDLFNYEKS